MTTIRATTTDHLIHQADSNWITGIVAGLEVHALVYDEPSRYGMRQNKRISKLFVKSLAYYSNGAWTLGGVVYDYDRNTIAANSIDKATLATVVAAIAKEIG